MAFYWHDDRVGAMRSGSTLLWPYNCGNLFPCKSDPADGVALDLKLTGFDPELTALYPHALTSEAPSYQLAWAIGDYERLDLGQTEAGTEVSVWYLPGNEYEATEGTKSLRAAFDFLEQTYGEYRFGYEVGSVEVSGLGYAAWNTTPIGTSTPAPWTTPRSTFTKLPTGGLALACASPAGRISCCPRARRPT